MMITNLNSHKNNGTYKAWTKTILQRIDSKITSLQDYMVYNYPEYIVYNSPNRSNPEDLRELKYQYDDDENQVSLFFPTKLGWHCGFYNQSDYGDGIFMFNTSKDGVYQSCGIPIQTTEYFLFTYNERDNNILTYDLTDNISRYYCFKYHTLDDDISEIVDIKEYFDINNNQISLKPSAQADLDHWTLYVLLHKTHTKHYGVIKQLLWDSKTKQCNIQTTTPPGVWWIDPEFSGDMKDYRPIDNKSIEDVPLCSPGIDTHKIDTMDGGIDIRFRNFLSGYICILNKQPRGDNNENNPDKQDLSAYLIAPVGNGAYYYLNRSDNDLIATYTQNVLGQFVNKVRISLGQNLRYKTPESVYYLNTSFSIPNMTVSKEGEITNNLTDHKGNLWTGGSEIIVQPTWNTNGEEVMMDVYYDIYELAQNRVLTHNLSINIQQNTESNAIRVELF